MTLVVEPVLSYTASRLLALGISVASGRRWHRSAATDVLGAWIAARAVLRSRMKQSLDLYDILLNALDADGGSEVSVMRIRAQINRAAALMTLGRLREGSAAFDELFALPAAQLMNAMHGARPDGRFDSTDIAIAFLTNGSPESDTEALTAARERLRQQSTGAASRGHRLNARIALLIGKRP